MSDGNTMTPERLAQIEEQWTPNVGPPLNGRQTVLELVAALREAQQNQLDTERTYVQLRDFHDTQMQAARAECDTLAATLERVREVAYGAVDIAITADSPPPHAKYIDVTRLRTALDGEQHDQPDP